jgi:hypothetical protein
VPDRAAVCVGVVLGRFAGMVRGMKPVAVCDMRVVRGLFVILFGVVLGSLAVVGRSMLVVFSSFSVMFRSFVVVHRDILFPGEICGCGGVAGSAR